MSREPSILKIEIVGSKDALSTTARMGGRLVGSQWEDEELFSMVASEETMAECRSMGSP